MYVNLSNYGGDFEKIFSSELDKATDVTIAVGYTGADILKRYTPVFEEKVNKGGEVKFLLGMAFYEGLNTKTFDLLNKLHSSIKGNYKSGVYVCYSNRFHGKIYKFSRENESNIYVGSSNFSSSGLSNNIECNVKVPNNTEPDVNRFLEHMFASNSSAEIIKTDITLRDGQSFKKRIDQSLLSKTNKFNINEINYAESSVIEIPLRKIVNNKKSSLNTYFGKGRLNRNTGKVNPRPWYEIEIIVSNTITSNPNYPKGDFEAYTDDGYILSMRTQGDYYKNMRSKKSLQIFGMWLKGKLQKSGALLPLTFVTEDTLDIYGNDTLRLYPLGENKYYMEF